ncbi:Predicted transcriptional regulator [Phocoenobacter uteri]|uniref:Predicted transcriptional regulator n=1 Tax=Phocoenobacter uteri TaxID=146806 RepID=A0A379CAJ9_9PAST|nr:AlpA family phage regulatory protein [Phocoenobacter uteri]MDG6881260.1 hypothetical protein [Phocoenobacter uteri]SUB59284.1 Predicted transcriptional regulator [Phocoenobacter uteri]
MENKIITGIQNPEPNIEFIRKQDVIKLFQVSPAVFDRWQRKDSGYYRPDFPKKIKQGSNYVVYVRSEIKAYMQKLIDERDNQTEQGGNDD